MNPRFSVAILLLLAATAWVATSEARQTDDESSESADATSSILPTGELVTLYAVDDSSCSFDFDRGTVVEVDRARLDLAVADMVFGRYSEGVLTFAHARNARAIVIDLGEEYVEANSQPTDEAPRVPLSIFYSIFLDGRRIKYVDGGGTLHHHRRGQDVLNQYPDAGAFHVEPKEGHTYLLRYAERLHGVSRLVKFQVIDVEPGRWLTFRWAPMA